SYVGGVAASLPHAARELAHTRGPTTRDCANPWKTFDNPLLFRHEWAKLIFYGDGFDREIADLIMTTSMEAAEALRHGGFLGPQSPPCLAWTNPIVGPAVLGRYGCQGVNRS
ncbi:hypothetical protein, partial [Rhizobium sp. SEMIA 4085]|uniref:hypothetical protein n=1 Tax=Rhizobium sp. SEMIA 4085 TaxID=2137761 RepID=UPI001AEEE8E5